MDTRTRNTRGGCPTSPSGTETRKARQPYYVTDDKQCFLVMDEDDLEIAGVDSLLVGDDQLEVWTTFDSEATWLGELEQSNAEWEHVETKEEEHQQLVDYMTQLVTETGLDAQNYKCAGCGGALGIVFGDARVCHFDGKSYCNQCHHGNHAIIPGRLLYNWEFQKRPVCNKCYKFLNHMETMPALDLSVINSSLYDYVPVLKEVHRLRVQLKELIPYLLSCQKCLTARAGSRFTQGSKLSPLYENEHIFSVRELVKVQKGSSLKSLSKTVKNGTRHVLNCSHCSSKGYTCQLCHSSKMIYPFDTQNVYKCSSCTSLSHLTCCSGKCPNC